MMIKRIQKKVKEVGIHFTFLFTNSCFNKFSWISNKFSTKDKFDKYKALLNASFNIALDQHVIIIEVSERAQKKNTVIKQKNGEKEWMEKLKKYILDFNL